MSRRRSGQGGSRSSAQRAVTGRQVMVPSARSDIYVALLGVALGAIVIGCILLALVMNRYEFKMKAAQVTASPAAIAFVSTPMESSPTS